MTDRRSERASRGTPIRPGRRLARPGCWCSRWPGCSCWSAVLALGPSVSPGVAARRSSRTPAGAERIDLITPRSVPIRSTRPVRGADAGSTRCQIRPTATAWWPRCSPTWRTSGRRNCPRPAAGARCRRPAGTSRWTPRRHAGPASRCASPTRRRSPGTRSTARRRTASSSIPRHWCRCCSGRTAAPALAAAFAHEFGHAVQAQVGPTAADRRRGSGPLPVDPDRGAGRLRRRGVPGLGVRRVPPSGCTSRRRHWSGRSPRCWTSGTRPRCRRADPTAHGLGLDRLGFLLTGSGAAGRRAGDDRRRPGADPRARGCDDQPAVHAAPVRPRPPTRWRPQRPR